MELTSCRPSGALNFEMAARSLEGVKISQPLTVLSQKFWTELGYQISLKKKKPYLIKCQEDIRANES
jgi:hypothetical protein